MRAEGVDFRTNVHVGVDISTAKLQADFDAVVLAGGAEQPRDLAVTGRNLHNVHFAMDFLRGNSDVLEYLVVQKISMSSSSAAAIPVQIVSEPPTGMAQNRSPRSRFYQSLLKRRIRL